MSKALVCWYEWRNGQGQAYSISVSDLFTRFMTKSDANAFQVPASAAGFTRLFEVKGYLTTTEIDQ